MATINDVARLAGVSSSTVSKYINGGNLRKEKIAAIESAIAELDYRVNPFGRSLKTQRTMSIGVLLPSITAPFFGTVFTATERLLRQNGYHTLISCYDSNHGLERDYLNYLLNSSVDGLLYFPGDLTASEFLELTALSRIPIVQMDRMIPGVETDVVLSENIEAVHQSISYLIHRGHRRIAIIAGPTSVFTARERTAGYLRALDRHNIAYDDTLVISGALSFSTGYQGFLDLINLKNPPTAIFSTNHDITIGLITAARERNIRIPDDIDIFGYDCVDICRKMTPPLPVVQQPEAEIGTIAAQYLIDRLEGYSGAPRQTRLPCKLVL